jgi:uncharacterized membrane protein YdjX (TVP38/TMEM64 family)
LRIGTRYPSAKSIEEHGTKVRNATERESGFGARTLIVTFGVGAILAAAIGIFVIREIGVDTIFRWIVESWQLLQAAPPIVFFGAMSLLTIFPVPLSPFYITAGTLYGIGPSLLWIPPAIVLNNLIAYTLTTTFLRPWLQATVAKRGLAIPTVSTMREQILLITMVRITPGPPYFLQSLVLGLAGVDLLPFLLISLPVHMIFAVGFVVLGQSAFDGQLGLAIGAVALILTASICGKFFYERLQRISNPDSASDSE